MNPYDHEVKVNKLLSAKQQNPQFNTKQLEDQIDIMVYSDPIRRIPTERNPFRDKPYNLTYEEAEIIDPEIGSVISKEDYEKYQIQ